MKRFKHCNINTKDLTAEKLYTAVVNELFQGISWEQMDDVIRWYHLDRNYILKRLNQLITEYNESCASASVTQLIKETSKDVCKPFGSEGFMNKIKYKIGGNK